MPTLLVFPVFPALSMVLLGVFWLITMVWLYSSGEIVMQDCDMSNSNVPPKVFCIDENDTETCHCGYKTSFDRNLQGALAYYAFGFLWGSQWIIAVTYLILACVFVQYYFAGGEYNAVKNSPLTTATKKMIWYHSGTAAVGSFFVAILQFIRVIVRFVVHRMKKLGKDSKVMKYIGYYVEYCLWYLQKCIEWLNRNAYIMTAIEGTSFCSSAWNSLSLMVKNVASVAAVSVVGDIMLFLGKLSVALGSGVIAFLMLDDNNFNYGDEKVSSPLFIVIVVCLFAFVIASVFMSIVEFGIDTIILCYCKDCDDNAGTPVNAPPALTSALGIAGKVKQQRIEAAQARAERAHAD
jgi:choline transporter-like protein 2/4/5